MKMKRIPLIGSIMDLLLIFSWVKTEKSILLIILLKWYALNDFATVDGVIWFSYETFCLRVQCKLVVKSLDLLTDRNNCGERDSATGALLATDRQYQIVLSRYLGLLDSKLNVLVR